MRQSYVSVSCPKAYIRLKTDVTSGGCWEWRGSRRPDGYAETRRGGAKMLAHRFSYEVHVGPIPNGLQLDHLCFNRSCVNPSHLEPVTNKVNSTRAQDRKQSLKAHCSVGHRLTEQNTYRRPGAPWLRECRECRKTAKHVYDVRVGRVRPRIMGYNTKQLKES